MRNRFALAAALGIALLSPGAAAADVPDRNLSPMHCLTDGGTVLELEPGVHVPEVSWEKLDAEIRRLQEAETRLTAERDSYRKSASGRTWTLRGIVAGAFAAGIVAGILSTR
jgi:hypothetical protein